MGKTKTLMSLCAVFAIAPVAVAAEVPSPNEANKVVEYYYSDAKEPVLMEFKICEAIHEDGDEKNNCKGELASGDIPEGTKAYLWMKFLVPGDAAPGILMQLNHKGITRDTYSRNLTGSVRYRTWHSVEFSKAGDWDIQIFYEGEDDVKELYSSTVKVTEAMPEVADQQ